MATFGILQASDLHFAPQPLRVSPLDYPLGALLLWRAGYGLLASHDPRKAAALTNFARKNRAAYDFVLLTGDLATAGSPAHLDVAAGYVTGSPPSGATIARGRSGRSFPSRRPIRLLPGNHDRYRGLGLPGSTAFDDAFGPTGYWNARQGVQVLHEQADGAARLVVIGADFSLRRSHVPSAVPPPLYLGQGWADNRRVTLLRRLTEAKRNEYPGAGIIWALHFDPVDASCGLRLRGRRRLIRVADQVGVSAILCGHIHADIEPRTGQGSSVQVLGCGATTQHYVRDPSGCFLQLVTVDVKPGSCVVAPPQRYYYRDGRFRPRPAAESAGEAERALS